jgi:hypothetical protein
VPPDAPLDHDGLLDEQGAAAAFAARTRPRGRLEFDPVTSLAEGAEGTLAPEDLDARPEEVPDAPESGRVHERPFQHLAGEQDFLANLAGDADEDRVAVEGTQLTFDGLDLAADLDQERHD